MDDGNQYGGVFALSVVHEPKPANDDFATRRYLVGTNATVNDTLIGATTEPGEPGYYLVASVWYAYVAPANGTLLVTVTSTFGATLQIYADQNNSLVCLYPHPHPHPH